MRPRRASQLRESGLQIVSPHGNVTVRPKLVTANEIEAPYDAVLLGVKAYSLDAAIDDLAAAVGPETTILPLLNGMRHLDALEARFGANQVLGGQCLISAALDPDGRILHLSDTHSLSFGERKMLDTARNLLIKELSLAKGVNEDDIEGDLKTIFNC